MATSLKTQIYQINTMNEQDKEKIINELYLINSKIFSGVDLNEMKNFLTNPKADRIKYLVYRDKYGNAVGYTAIIFFLLKMEGGLKGIINATIGILPEFRGGIKGPKKFFLFESVKWKCRHPTVPLYIVEGNVHPASYLLLVRDLPRLWPRPGDDGSPEMQKLLLTVADILDMKCPDPKRPFVRDLVWTTVENEYERAYWANSRMPEIRDYISRNPNYSSGEGLLYILPFDAKNFFINLYALIKNNILKSLNNFSRYFLMSPFGQKLLTTSRIANYLSNADIFKDVDFSELMQLAEHARIIYLPRKHLLIREGEVSDALYIIVNGVVDVFITDDSGNKKVINKIETGQLFGEIAALAGIPRIASVRISTPCILCQINRAYILSFLDKNQQCAEKIWPVFVQRKLSSYLFEFDRIDVYQPDQIKKILSDSKPQVLKAGDKLNINENQVLFLAMGRLASSGTIWHSVSAPALSIIKQSMSFNVIDHTIIISAPIPKDENKE